MSDLTDTDPMPFGKHKDKLMQDVPASYLLWLWYDGGLKKEHESGLSGDRLAVARYIIENLHALMQECLDYE